MLLRRRQWRHLLLVACALSVAVLLDFQRAEPLFSFPLAPRILVTGGSGVLGREIIPLLHAAGYAVTVLDLDPHPHSHLHNVRAVPGDVRDPATLTRALSGAKGVIHLAGYRAAACAENETDCEDVNVRGTEALLDHLKGWIVYPSSMQINTNTTNAYTRTKVAAEAAIRTRPRAAILRLGEVYGSRDTAADVAPDAMGLALAHRPIPLFGDPLVDFVHVSDVAEAVLAAVAWVQRNSYIGEYDIGSGTATRASEYVRKILTLTGANSPVRLLPADTPDITSDSGRTTSQLGWRARVELDDGLRALHASLLHDTVTFLSQEREGCEPKPYTQADLLKLDGCTGTLAADVAGQPFYAFFDPAQSANEHHARPEVAKDTQGWRDTDEPQLWAFELTQHGGMAALRLRRTLGNDTVYFEEPSGASTFFATLHGDDVYLQLSTDAEVLVPWSLAPPPPLGVESLPDVAQFGGRYRLTPFCCPRPALWPFAADDPLASNVLDARLSATRAFNASQVRTRCARLAKAEKLARERLARAEAESGEIPLAPLPTGRSADWRMRGRDVCTNLCSHPTVCVDTGDCVCAQHGCTERSPVAGGQGEAEVEPEEGWKAVLRPTARRYIRIASLPSMNVTRLPPAAEEDYQRDPEKYERVQTEYHGCFSADSALERGARLHASQYGDGALVFAPYYSWTARFPPIDEWVGHALSQLPKLDAADLAVPFMFDWGRCNTVLHGLYAVRALSSVHESVARASAWQPMGDVNSQCYYHDQDVVVPARTCRQEDLRVGYAHLKPPRERRNLVFFKGAPNGAGAGVRAKLACERPHTHRGRLVGAHSLKRYWNRYAEGTEHLSQEQAYLATLGDTVFCPVPRGTAGWSPRITDVLYTGCIPVLIGDQTHMPFWDVLDWGAFSVSVEEKDVQRLEEVLLRLSWDEVERLHASVRAVREAFLYPPEGRMEDSKGVGPFFFAAHSAGLLRSTVFP